MVVQYEECNDNRPFTPLGLDCAIPTADAANSLDGKLTAVVTYATRYKLPNGEYATVKFGLGKDITVNAIVGIPTIKLLKLVLDLDDHRCLSKVLGIWFPFVYADAAPRLPPGVTFDEKSFVRPPCATKDGQLLLTKLGDSLLVSHIPCTPDES